jgi:hypothetical protein
MKQNQKNGTCVSMKICLLSLEMDLSLIAEYKKRMIIRLIKITTSKSLVRLFLLTKKEALILRCLEYFFGGVRVF